MESDHSVRPVPGSRPASRCRRFRWVVLPLMLLPLVGYAAGYVALRAAARIRVWGSSSLVGPLRVRGRTWVTAADLFRFYEPLIAWETRRRRAADAAPR